MKLIVLLFFCKLYISYCTANHNCSDLKLELVQVLLRHGARTPHKKSLKVFNETDIAAYEPYGFGGLNDVGKRQEYAFGTFLRKRYANYLNSTYKPEDVYAYSSEIARTQMSLQLVLFGLYSQDPMVSRLGSTAIPYDHVPRKLDILLESHRRPQFRELRDQAINSDEFKRNFANYSEFFQFVEEKIIKKDNNTLENVHAVFDVLIANKYMGLSLPEWYTEDIEKKFIELEEIVRDALVATPELKKMGPGPLIKTTIENMNLNGTFNNPRKIYLYGGHDTNIAMVTRAYNISQFRYPAFGSALILEKLRNCDDEVYVRLLAWDGEGKLITLKLGKHQDTCPIQDYLKLGENSIPSEKEIDKMLGDLSAKQIKKMFFKDDMVKQA